VPGRSRSRPAGQPQPRRDEQPRRQTPSAPNPPGAHFLTDRRLIAQLVRASGASQASLVFDLGAGYGALTGPLARTGARVIAVERDAALARRLRSRFGDDPRVGVVEGDLRAIPWPRRPFHVVASPPFALTTLLCRRLLGDDAVRLAGAELILAWGAARWLSGEPRDAQTARWAARYEIRLVRRVVPASFSPPPATAAAYVRIRPRERRLG
jgi:23S rRNA (adenine-N6)-dimethyltransferase